ATGPSAGARRAPAFSRRCSPTPPVAGSATCPRWPTAIRRTIRAAARNKRGPSASCCGRSGRDLLRLELPDDVLLHLGRVVHAFPAESAVAVHDLHRDGQRERRRRVGKRDALSLEEQL